MTDYKTQYLEIKEKYKKMKAQYYQLKLKSSGGSELKYYNKGDSKIKFQFKEYEDIAKGTAMTLCNNEMLVITKDGTVLLNSNKILDLKEDNKFVWEEYEEGLLGVACKGSTVYLLL